MTSWAMAWMENDDMNASSRNKIDKWWNQCGIMMKYVMALVKDSCLPQMLKTPLSTLLSDNVVSYVVLHGLSQGLNNVG